MSINGVYDSSKVLFFTGNSGSGKDTIMKGLKEKLENLGFSVIVPKRLITRPSHKSEKFISLDEDTFNRFLKEFKFILHWYIYGNYYGYLKNDVISYLNGDSYLLLNISRAIALDALTKFPNGKLINLITDTEKAIERITKRKRDSEEMIQQRITRMKTKIPLPEIFLTLHNNELSDIPINIQKIINGIKIN
ncbi:MAG: hypothetical protein ACW981_17405 [Candidatus Hodarchaeales archaeon]|jgi:phosphonate metabolism protein PhnN/1,5-bisphosphokinase (PRPP-forming)